MHYKSLALTLALLASLQPAAYSQTELDMAANHQNCDQAAKAEKSPSDTNMCSMGGPTVLTEEYIRSGRAEKTLKLPDVLPPEAPVPDALKQSVSTTGLQRATSANAGANSKARVAIRFDIT